MSTVVPHENASNTELIRWAFEKLNDRDVMPLKQFWTDATVERFPDRTCRGADDIANYFKEALRRFRTSTWRSSPLSSKTSMSSFTGT